LARVNRWGEDDEGQLTVIAQGDQTLLGFYLERDVTNKLQVVYVDRRGFEFPTAMGYWVTFVEIEGYDQ
jgi:hypothetical protein